MGGDSRNGPCVRRGSLDRFGRGAGQIQQCHQSAVGCAANPPGSGPRQEGKISAPRLLGIPVQARESLGLQLFPVRIRAIGGHSKKILRSRPRYCTTEQHPTRWTRSFDRALSPVAVDRMGGLTLISRQRRTPEHRNCKPHTTSPKQTLNPKH